MVPGSISFSHLFASITYVWHVSGATTECFWLCPCQETDRQNTDRDRHTDEQTYIIKTHRQTCVRTETRQDGSGSKKKTLVKKRTEDASKSTSLFWNFRHGKSHFQIPSFNRIFCARRITTRPGSPFFKNWPDVSQRDPPFFCGLKRRNNATLL